MQCTSAQNAVGHLWISQNEVQGNAVILLREQMKLHVRVHHKKKLYDIHKVKNALVNSYVLRRGVHRKQSRHIGFILGTCWTRLSVEPPETFTQISSKRLYQLTVHNRSTKQLTQEWDLRFTHRCCPLGYDAATFGDYFLTFWKIEVPSCLLSSSPIRFFFQWQRHTLEDVNLQSLQQMISNPN